MAFGTPAALAQETNLTFGEGASDPSLPVEVTSETLDVNQADGSAEFKGNVIVVQGEMRLSARRVLVIYNEEKSAIERMEATGDVVLASGPDAAEADRADYTIDSGVIVLTGNALLMQGPNTLASDKVTVNLETGTAQMVGRVKTILQTGGN
ncbi:lipopolysaccharide transport periplasmic protein LptA [Ruegeria sediminis]|uniref:lipopolysaccharide transport periplasmic protein LptA n=1 Tax=Ruegeria sediminis TaxID=2583820 RepID=UPI001FE62C87|nr:lipopolysaccharide transport periplasmic protein LptA [Ruegeria sediminis]